LLDLKTVQTPFYATVGVTDLAVEAVREYVADVQTRVRGYQQSVAKVDLQPKALRDQAVTVVSTRVDALSKDAKAVPAALNDTYGDLVKRGESLVGRIRRQQSTQQTVKSAETTKAKAKTTRTQATKATKTTAKKATTTAKKQSAPSRSSAKATVTAAKATASSAGQAVADAAQKVGD